MKIRTLSIACGTTAALTLAGCTAFYKNTDACEQMMRSKLADVTQEQMPNVSIDKFSVSHTGTGIHGTRVVVEGTLSHMQTASEVAAANPPKAASTVSAAMPAGASQPGVAAMASGAAAQEGVASDAALASAPASGVTATATLAATQTTQTTQSAQAASAVTVTKPVKPKKVVRAAAAECTFNGLSLASFRWLSPAALVKTNEGETDDAAE